MSRTKQELTEEIENGAIAAIECPSCRAAVGVRCRGMIQSDKVQYLGSIQGVIHSLITEGSETSFKIRELYSDTLIKCYYKSAQYEAVVEVLKRQSAVVHVEGWATASRAEHRVLWIDVERIVRAVEYHEGDVDKFLGLLSNAEENSDQSH